MEICNITSPQENKLFQTQILVTEHISHIIINVKSECYLPYAMSSNFRSQINCWGWKTSLKHTVVASMHQVQMYTEQACGSHGGHELLNSPKPLFQGIVVEIPQHQLPLFILIYCVCSPTPTTLGSYQLCNKLHEVRKYACWVIKCAVHLI